MPNHAKPFPAPRAQKNDSRKKLNYYVNWEFYDAVIIHNGGPHVSSNPRKIVLFDSSQILEK